jgi:hypothetical protein
MFRNSRTGRDEHIGEVRMPADSLQMQIQADAEAEAPEGCALADSLQMQAGRDAGGQIREVPPPANSLQIQEMQVQRNAEGRFVPGSRNRATMIAEQLFDNATGDLSREAINKALDGDSAVLRLVVSRIIGPRRHRPSSFPLPPLRSAADVAPALATIAAAAERAISTGEASEMSQIVERFMRALEAGELATRVAQLKRVRCLG